MNLGEAIRNQRKNLKIKQSDLAKECQITPSYLSMIEKNKKEPNLSTLKKLSENLNLPLPVLFFKSLDSSDIPEEKREAYKLVSETFGNLINNIFLTTDSK